MYPYKARPSPAAITMRTGSSGKRHRAPAGSSKEAPEWARFTYLDSVRPGAYADGRAGPCVVRECAHQLKRFGTRLLYLQSGMHFHSACSRRSAWPIVLATHSILEYFSQRAFHATSAQAFEAAFGLTLDEFYDEFAAWRAEGFPRDE